MRKIVIAGAFFGSTALTIGAQPGTSTPIQVERIQVQETNTKANHDNKLISDEGISTWIKNAQALATVAGIVIGGLWAYFNYFRGRVNRPRFEITLCGHHIEGKDIRCIIAQHSIKNVGLSKVDISHEGSGLIVSFYNKDTYVPDIHSVDWDELAVFSVLEEHHWIEPGETVNESRMIALPLADTVAVRMALTVMSRVKTVWFSTRRVVWYSDTIIPILPLRADDTAKAD